MKGISPVVAIVLLIAVAVIASVGVWYWVGTYVSKPVLEPVSTAILITDCNTTHVLVRNVGGVPVNLDADIYNTTDKVGVLNLSGSPLNATQVNYIPIVNASNSSQIITVPVGTYRIIDPAYPDYLIYDCN